MGDAVRCEQCSCITPVGSYIKQKLKWLVSARFACSSSSLLALLDSALERTSVELSHSTQETVVPMLLTMEPTMATMKNTMLITQLMIPVMPVNVDVEVVMM